MRLIDCDLDVGGVVAHPMTISEPEPEWTVPRDNGTIPPQLYDFYRTANCLSLSSQPRFLADPDTLLFAYFKNVMTELRESFEAIPEILAELWNAHEVEYSPIKKARDIPFDPDGIKRSRRAFKALVIELGGILDQFAEISALFFHRLGGLSLGRAMFSSLHSSVKADSRPGSAVHSPKEIQFDNLIATLRGHIEVNDPEQDWLDVFLRFRNKAAHIGNHTFHTAGLRGAGESIEVFTFLPNTWPRMGEQLVKRGPATNSGRTELRDWLLESYLGQDLIQYSDGLTKRITKMIGDGLDALRRTYVEFETFSPDAAAYSSLKAEQGKRFRFKYFS